MLSIAAFDSGGSDWIALAVRNGIPEKVVDGLTAMIVTSCPAYSFDISL